MYEELVKRLRYAAGYDERIVIQDAKDAADAIEDLAKKHEAQRENLIALMNAHDWIPVAERLPEESEDSLFYTEWVGKSGVIYREIQLTNLAELKYYGYKPIAWMPLPERPKDGEA